MRAVIAVLLSSITAVAAAPLPSPSSAEICGDCHRAIHEGWKGSGHATAMESRLFQDALKLATSDYGAPGRKVCLSCHAPVGTQINDADLIRKVSWEGVTCDYCHSLREVSPSDGNFKARVEFTGAKSGPSKDAASPAHDSVFSPVHTSSLACAVCHDYVNGEGFPVLTTYTEWKKSSYGEGKMECQSCHMALVQGDVVDPRVKRDAGESVNLHQMPGSHSVDQLTKAVRLQLSTTRSGDNLEVTVKLTNAGAGHAVPTGSPLRQLILEVRAHSYAGHHYKAEKTYARSVSDEDGRLLAHEHDVFMKAAKQVEDTRLKAGETRVEVFRFAVPRSAQARVEADLYYYYSPTATEETQERIKFLNVTRLVS